MAQESDQQQLFRSKLRGGRKWILMVFIVAAAVGGGVWFFLGREGEMTEEAQETRPLVAVKRFGELVEGATIDQIATLEPAESGPLVARTGGRVTSLIAQLGDQVTAGQVIVQIDDGGEPNPAQAQMNTAAAALNVFDDIRRQALTAADLAVETARTSVQAAQTGRSLTSEQLSKSREQADLAVRQAELAFTDVQESQNRDQLVRAADLALRAAALAQDQATLARSLGDQQASDGLKQAQLGLEAAETGRKRTAAELTSQRVTLAGQVEVAREQVRLTQVTAPLAGQVTRLTVRVGDYVQPGSEIGEIIAFAGAKVTLEVTTGVRALLGIGQEITMSAGGQNFTGQVVRLADAPRGDVALWQVEVLISATPEVVHPGELVVVKLPVGVGSKAAAFIPLDAVVVREGGLKLFTADNEGVVSEHAVTVVEFASDFVEGQVDLDSETLVIVSNNRALQAGDKVRIQ